MNRDEGIKGAGLSTERLLLGQDVEVMGGKGERSEMTDESEKANIGALW